MPVHLSDVLPLRFYPTPELNPDLDGPPLNLTLTWMVRSFTAMFGLDTAWIT